MSFGEGRVHFIGIGGAGMSAIAKVLVERGVDVTGSDLKGSRITDALIEMGAHVHIGHDPAHVEGAGLVVVSAAIDDSNPELARARELGLEVISRGAALARLLERDRAIVVAGTHGKTTCTSMIVSIFHAAGRDPSYLVGGGLNDAGTNARSGRDPVVVAESDESDGSFLLLSPNVAVITNIEMDHHDQWRSLAELRGAFAEFLGRVPGDGTIVVPAGDEIAAAADPRRIFRFGGDGDDGDVVATDIEPRGGGISFVLSHGGETQEVELRVPGHHNVTNALAAAGAALAEGISLSDIARGLSSFAGVERRFDLHGEAAGITVVDDYAHHPSEVRATLAAAREGRWRRVVAVFQPHRYSRTAALWRDFGPAFAEADRIVVTDVYGAGEVPVPGITGKLVADAAALSLPGRPIAYIPHRSDLAAYLVATARPGDLLLTLGAGDITSVGAEFLTRIEQRT